MRSRPRYAVRAGAVALVAVAALVANGADSAASVGPEWTSGSSLPAAPDGSAVDGGRSGRSVSAVSPGVDQPRRRWIWPLEPRPAVMARFAAPEVRWGSGHRGVDLAATVGQAVLAPSDGVVAFRGVVVDRGAVVIETPEGLRTTFEPVDSSLTVGTPVTQGQPVATVAGTPGHCTPATCLHWGVLRDGVYLDPLALVGTRVVLLPLLPLLPVLPLRPG